MGTPRQNLEAEIKRLEAKHGPENPLVKDFKAQLAAMQPQSESTLDRFVGAGSPSKGGRPPKQTFDVEAANALKKALSEKMGGPHKPRD